MHNAPLTPPATPPPQQHQPFRCPSTPESRIGKLLGESLQLKGILGTGAYGVVYSAFDLYTQTWYAVKALSKTNANGHPLDQRQREFQQREIQLHYAASAHPNIVSMLKIVDDPECTYVILEYCPEGDLFSNITERGRYVSDDALIRRAFLQILDAVEHCHRLGIYHRDLKPENILVSNSGADVLLADFGLATTDAESEDHGCGSTFYMSPECLDQTSRKPSYRCAPNDIWSLGVILVNLTCGRNPWKQASVEDSTYRAFTRNRNFLKTILPLSDELNDILGMIFERNPEDRISVGQLKHAIWACSTFTTTQQAIPTQEPITPPHSPQASTANDSSYDSFSDDVFSDDGSICSDEGSLTGSCSTISDEADSDCDTGYESMEEEQESFEVVDQASSPEASQDIYFPSIPAEPSKVPQQVPCVPLQPQYVPPQPYYGNPYVSPAKPGSFAWFQNCWGQQLSDQVHVIRDIRPACFYPAYHVPHYSPWAQPC